MKPGNRVVNSLDLDASSECSSSNRDLVWGPSAGSCSNSDQLSRTCEEALKTDPENLSLLEDLARAQWFMQDIDPLLRTVQRMIRLNPVQSGYHLLQGMAYSANGQFAKALTSYRQAQALAAHLTFAQHVEEQLEMLDARQLGMISTLLEFDLPFRRRFNLDPAATLLEHGFCLSKPYFGNRSIQKIPTACALGLGRSS